MVIVEDTYSGEFCTYKDVAEAAKYTYQNLDTSSGQTMADFIVYDVAFSGEFVMEDMPSFKVEWSDV